MLTTLVSVNPVYVRFQGDESAYLRYVAESRNATRAAPVWIGLALRVGRFEGPNADPVLLGKS